MVVIKETPKIKVSVSEDFFKLPNQFRTKSWVFTKEENNESEREVGTEIRSNKAG